MRAIKTDVNDADEDAQVLACKSNDLCGISSFNN